MKTPKKPSAPVDARTFNEACDLRRDNFSSHGPMPDCLKKPSYPTGLFVALAIGFLVWVITSSTVLQ